MQAAAHWSLFTAYGLGPGAYGPRLTSFCSYCSYCSLLTVYCCYLTALRKASSPNIMTIVPEIRFTQRMVS